MRRVLPARARREQLRSGENHEQDERDACEQLDAGLAALAGSRAVHGRCPDSRGGPPCPSVALRVTERDSADDGRDRQPHRDLPVGRADHAQRSGPAAGQRAACREPVDRRRHRLRERPRVMPFRPATTSARRPRAATRRSSGPRAAEAARRARRSPDRTDRGAATRERDCRSRCHAATARSSRNPRIARTSRAPGRDPHTNERYWRQTATSAPAAATSSRMNSSAPPAVSVSWLDAASARTIVPTAP